MYYLNTGQQSCYDEAGHVIDCINSGQDAEFKNGYTWPSPRFILRWEIVEDLLTGLYWTRQANFAQFPLTWAEALEYVQEMNRQNILGYHDWRLPNRRELRSLMSYQTRKPALPAGYPFTDVFQSWYWTSTTAAISPEHAWTIHLEGARMFYGGKDQSYLLWPVRGTGRDILAVTGEQECHDEQGKPVNCSGTGQDGEYQMGHNWPQPRFRITKNGLQDGLTHLCWYRNANVTHQPVTWQKALQAIHQLNQQADTNRWRLPNINELESLVDCAQWKPALPQQAVFYDVQDGYWSSTTSVFEPDWAWALYLYKGATGVGQKRDPHFFVWPVSDGS